MKADNAYSGVEGTTSLHLSAYRGHLLLRQPYIEVNAKDAEGKIVEYE